MLFLMIKEINSGSLQLFTFFLHFYSSSISLYLILPIRRGRGGGHSLIAPTNKVGLYTDSVCKVWDIFFLFSRFVHRPCTIRCFPNLNQYFQKRRWVFEYRFSTFLFDGKVGRSRLGFRSQFGPLQ